MAATGLLAPFTLAPAPAHALTAQETYSHAAVSATQQVRTARALGSLRYSRCLAQLAWAQAHRMARRHEMFHQDMGTVLRTCHLSWAAENVAYGFPTGTSVVYDGWMKSPPHRANLLSRHYTMMAIGAVRSGDGRWYVSQVFGRPA